MTDYFAVQLPPEQIRAISSIGLAHLGDAVFELLVRTWLCAGGKATGRGLHRATVALGPQRQRPFHPGPRQPGPVPAGHGSGGPAGIPVFTGQARPGQPAVLPDDGGGVTCRWMPFA